MPDIFDPFNDRLSRNIRNDLSKSFAEVLTRNDSASIREPVDRWLEMALPPACRAYVMDRRRCYQAVIDEIQSRGIVGEMEKAVVLWNRHLFFEAHELLEGIWQAAIGERRDALKGLIQAAGVFVHMAQGNRQAAQRLALRARALLLGHRRHLPNISNVDDLVDALADPDLKPPALVASP